MGRTLHDSEDENAQRYEREKQQDNPRWDFSSVDIQANHNMCSVGLCSWEHALQGKGSSNPSCRGFHSPWKLHNIIFFILPRDPYPVLPLDSFNGQKRIGSHWSFSSERIEISCWGVCSSVSVQRPKALAQIAYRYLCLQVGVWQIYKAWVLWGFQVKSWQRSLCLWTVEP